MDKKFNDARGMFYILFLACNKYGNDIQMSFP